MHKHLDLIDLATEAASLRQSGLSSGGLAEHNIAGSAEDDGLGVGEDGGDVKAAGALDVHEEAVGRLDKALELVHLLLIGGVHVEEIDRHIGKCGCVLGLGDESGGGRERGGGEGGG